MSLIRTAGVALARTRTAAEVRRFARGALSHLARVALALFLVLVVLPFDLRAAAAAGG